MCAAVPSGILLLQPWSLQGCFPHIFLSPFHLVHTIFNSFLNTHSLGAAILADGPSHALRWGCWSCLEQAVSSTGQSWPLLTEATPTVPCCQHLGSCIQHNCCLSLNLDHFLIRLFFVQLYCWRRGSYDSTQLRPHSWQYVSNSHYSFYKLSKSLKITVWLPVLVELNLCYRI